jgi:tetratricopeptide (TPR) repeat protein
MAAGVSGLRLSGGGWSCIVAVMKANVRWCGWAWSAVAFIAAAGPVSGGCSKEEAATHVHRVKDAGPPPTLVRPPFPQMATALHGQAVLDAMTLSLRVTAKSGAAVTSAYVLLGSTDDRCEEDAATIFAAAYKAAQNEVLKVEAAAGLMLAKVLDPGPTGYRERLTDAYGLNLYLATQKLAGRPVDAARAVTLAAVGRTEDGLAAARRLRDSPAHDAWMRLNEALAFVFSSQKGEAVASLDAAAALDTPPARVFLERGRLRLSLDDTAGALADAKRALARAPVSTRARLLRAQALALGEGFEEGRKELARLLSGGTAEHLGAEARMTAAFSAYKTDHPGVAKEQLAALAQLKGYEPEAAFAEGLYALLTSDWARAVLTLERAARHLAPGWALPHAQLGLARAALATGQYGQARAALNAHHAEQGPTSDAAGLLAAVFQKEQRHQQAADQLLLAYALDPYNPKRALAANRPLQEGGDEARMTMKQVWRLLGVGGARTAMPMIDEVARRHPRDPYVAWARVVAQKQLDAALPVGTAASDKAAEAAVEAVRALGRKAPHDAFPVAARKLLVDVLDEGQRELTAESLAKLQNDPDASVLTAAHQALGRGAARPKPTGH